MTYDPDYLNDEGQEYAVRRARRVHNDLRDSRRARAGTAAFVPIPDFGTPQGDPTAQPCHVRALHTHQRMVHEGVVLVKGGDRKYLAGTKRSILAVKALTEELGDRLVLLDPAAEEIMAMDEGPEAPA